MRLLILPLLLLLSGSMLQPTALAQPGPSPAVATWTLAGPATGNWNVPANWSSASIPDVSMFDAAAVSNGGTAIINTAITQQQGSIVLGLGVAANETGTLEIQSGGSITVVDDPAFPADGSVRVGQFAQQGVNAGTTTPNANAATGILRVLPGGTLNSVSLTLNGNAGSLIQLGGAGAGTATINTGRVLLGRTLRFIGTNTNFNSSGAGAEIAMQPTSILIPEITGATHTPLKTTGKAILGGTVTTDFNGVTPTLGQSWDIIDAAAVERQFATVNGDTGVPLPLPSQRMAVRTVNGGTNGKLVQLFVQQRPVLTVNRDTGAVSITNPGGLPLPIIGYNLQSARGSLSLANWQSLEDNAGVGGPGWFEANPSNTRLTELQSSGASNVAGTAAWSLGNIWQPTPPTQFLQNVEDLTFQYEDPVTESTVTGLIEYIGTGVPNNFVLYVDPNTGNVKFRNTSPFTVQIDGYTITSASNSLNSASWTSLQDQPGVAPNWFEGGDITDGRVSEVMSTGTTTVNANSATTFDLGGLFKTGGTQDLVFQFLLAGNSQPSTAVVVYQAATGGGVTGDFNNNGTVDAADYVLWRNGGPLENDPTPGVVDASDYGVWRANFGRTAAPAAGASLVGSAVPEPATLAMLMLGLVGPACGRGLRPRTSFVKFS